MQRFSDRRIIVTGAGSGIGQATAARLLDSGSDARALDLLSRFSAKRTTRFVAKQMKSVL